VNTPLNPLSPLQPLNHPLFDKHSVKVEIKRDDIIHPIISGNKWRKLKYNLAHVESQPQLKGAISFGGSYSNHIHAFAYACFKSNIPCIGIIRGEAQYANNFTLSCAKRWGMKLHFVDRKTYKRRSDADYLDTLQQQFPDYFIIPEGGSNALALQGVSEVITELNQQTQFDTLITPVGSGGTLAGLVKRNNESNNTNEAHKLIGISVLKGAEYLTQEVEDLINKDEKLTNQVRKQACEWEILHQFHRGGYAKFSQDDASRILALNKTFGIDFEPVYSGKMLLAFFDLLEQGYFKPNERIILLHTGGLQGVGGMVERGILNEADW